MNILQKKTISILILILFFSISSISIGQTEQLDLISWGIYSTPGSIAFQNNHLYICAGAVVIYDITDPDHPQERGHYRSLEPGNAGEIVVHNDHAFVTWASPSGYEIRVLDTSNPANPQMISSVKQTGVEFMNLKLDYPNLYFLSSSSISEYQVNILDMTEPTHPVEAGTFLLSDSLDIDSLHYPQRLMARDGFIYLTFGPRGSLGTAVLHILNASDPGRIIHADSLRLGTVDAGQTNSMRNGPRMSMDFRDDYLYVTGRFQADQAFQDTGFVEIKIIDIFNPCHPFIASKFYSTKNIRNLAHIDISGDTICATDRSSSLFILDCSDPLQPVELGSLRMPVPEYYNIDFEVKTDGTHAFLHLWDCFAVYMVDVSQPETPNLSAEIPFCHDQNDICVSETDSLLYMAVWNFYQMYVIGGMEISPSVLSRTVLKGYGWGIDTRDQYAYLAMGAATPYTSPDTSGGLFILDISDPLTPEIVGHYPSHPPEHENHDVQVVMDDKEPLACVVIGKPKQAACTFDYSPDPGMRLFDVSDPSDPLLLGSYFIDPLDTLEDRIQAMTAAFSGQFAFLGTSGNGMHILDISNTSSPSLACHWNPGYNYIRAIAVKDTLLFLANGDSLTILGIKNPAAPKWINSVWLQNDLIDLLINKDLAVSATTNGLILLDIHNPFAATEVASVRNIFAASPTHIDMLGSYIYVLCKGGGLYTFRFDGSSLVDENSPEQSKGFYMDQNYPNPFNTVTRIEYVLSAKTRVSLDIFDLLGRQVTTLIDRIQTPGRHTILWDGKNQNGTVAGSGIYFYRLKTTDGCTATKKLLLLK